MYNYVLHPLFCSMITGSFDQPRSLGNLCHFQPASWHHHAGVLEVWVCIGCDDKTFGAEYS